MSIDINRVEELTVDGADSRDYPDFCDAFFSYGIIDGRELTEDELDELTDNHGDIVGEMAYESFL